MDQEKIKKWLLVILVVIVGIILGALIITRWAGKDAPLANENASQGEQNNSKDLIDSLPSPEQAVSEKKDEPQIIKSLPAPEKKPTTKNIIDSLPSAR
jgi:flagellar basal body-associated protein FliL